MSISPMLLGIRNTAITTQHKSLGQEKGVKKCINQEKKPNNTNISCSVLAPFKVQLFSEWIYEVIVSPKCKPKIKRIPALPYKQGS